MRAYLINLDSDGERLCWMRGQFDIAGVTDWERVSAVDLRGPAGRARAAEWADRPRASLTPPEIGCLMSHAEVWRRIVARGDRLAAVFEDDVQLAPGLGALLAEDDWIPAALDLVRIETNMRRARIGRPVLARTAGIEIRPTIDNFLGTAGYVISRRRARRLLADFDRNGGPADRFIFLGALSPPVAQMVPALCVQTFRLEDDVQRPDFASTIQAEVKQRFADTLARGGNPAQTERRGPLIVLARKIVRALQLVRLRPQVAAVPFAGSFGRDG